MRAGRARRALLACAALLLLLGIAILALIEQLGWAPRAVGPYIERRASGHNSFIVAATGFTAQRLLALDRGTVDVPARLSDLALGAGASPAPASGSTGAVVPVSTPDELLAALRVARPGQAITLLPGTYLFRQRAIDVSRPGEAGAPIVVRAAQPGTVNIELNTLEGFHVSVPYWRFENLAIRGVCASDDYCEHAFHVVGGATHFQSVNNTITDFNAHFKINADDGRFPDNGLIERNTLTESRARETGAPVTPIDLVTASGWVIRANLISDFVKTGGNLVTYGAFAKGGGSGNVFERNIVWCEHKLRGYPGQRIGLSFGGGGTGPRMCREGRCITEHAEGILRANLIASCSDVAVYLNSAANTRVVDNTMLDTAGVDVRFATSSAFFDGNLIDGQVRSRDGGLVHEADNITTPLWRIYLGSHPVRGLFRAAEEGDLAWRGRAPARTANGADQGSATAKDLCGVRPRVPTVYGAFADFAACRVAP